MNRVKYNHIYVGDFETSVYEGQTVTEVWASAMVELNSEDVKIFHSIKETFNYFKLLNDNIIVYYHNLKFDGSFWLDYLIRKEEFEQAFEIMSDNPFVVEWLNDGDMKNNTFKYSISHMGQWYTITIKVNNHYIQIRDSLKLLPFSVKKIGKSFGTKHKKLDMEYEGYRYAGCEITKEECDYIANDVLVVKEALEIMYADGHNKLTIGGCCVEEFKKTLGKTGFDDDYDDIFPDLSTMEIDSSIFGAKTADEYIRKSYKGGWCYVVKGKENKIYNNGTTADVNSLYPSMMSSESGNYYPVRTPTFWIGNIPKEVYETATIDGEICNRRYFFVRIRTRFKLKDGKLPFIQIKSNYLYNGHEALETSDVWDKNQQKYVPFYFGTDGEIHEARVELTLTETDFTLFLENYDVYDFEVLDGCWFYTQIGIFDEYIDKYRQIKMTSKGAKRESAKLFLNNLYGKLASNTNSSFKVAYLKEDESIGFITVSEHNKKAGHIASGSAITSYARNFTIRHAQANFYGADKAGFIYADTDSIHCDLPPEEIKMCKVDDNAFCCWKLESCWDVGIFTRQKTYIEHIVAENQVPIDNPYFNIKCAGMPQRCKDLFELSMQGFVPDENTEKDYSQAEIDFLSIKREMSDFCVGLKVPSKLMPKRIKGGVLLKQTDYEMRG